MNKNGCSVQIAQSDDLPRMIEILQETGLFWEGGDRIEILQRKLAYDPDSFLVLRYEDQIIGMVILIYDPWCSFIWHLAVTPAYQGNGLGHLLAEEAESRLRARGTNCVGGYVLPTNEHSRSFFTKRGYLSFDPVIPIEKSLD